MKSAEYMKKILSNNKKLRQYKSRLNQLQNIRNNYSYFDSYSADLNAKCRNTISKLESGLKIQGGFNNAGESFRTMDLGRSDENLNNSEYYINEEIRRVQQIITELERTIKSDTNKMDIEKAKEDAEKAGKA